jgi:hypothetical protein
MKCPEKYIKAYIFFFINQWIEFKFENIPQIMVPIAARLCEKMNFMIMTK